MRKFYNHLVEIQLFMLQKNLLNFLAFRSDFQMIWTNIQVWILKYSSALFFFILSFLPTSHALFFFLLVIVQFWFKKVSSFIFRRGRRKKKRVDKISIQVSFPRPKFLGSAHAFRLLRQNDGRKTYCRRDFVTTAKSTTRCAYHRLPGCSR